MEDSRYIIYGADWFEGRANYQDALIYASQQISEIWKYNGTLGRCFAMIYDKLNQHRTICWMNNEHFIKYRKLY